MRQACGWMVVGSMWLVCQAALAKDKPKPADEEGIQMTGIEAFDEVFTRVGAIDARLAAAEGHIRTGRTNLNTALELERGTLIADGLAELQGRAGDKLTVAVNSRQVPTLTATEAVPTDVQEAIDAVNTMTGNFTASVTELQALVPEIQRLASETGKMPSRLKDEFDGNFLQTLFALPKTAKTLSHDVEVTAGLADRTTTLTTRMTDVLGAVQTEFVGGSGGSRKPRAPGAAPAPAPKPVPKPAAPKPTAPKVKPGTYAPNQ